VRRALIDNFIEYGSSCAAYCNAVCTIAIPTPISFYMNYRSPDGSGLKGSSRSALRWLNGRPAKRASTPGRRSTKGSLLSASQKSSSRLPSQIWHKVNARGCKATVRANPRSTTRASWSRRTRASAAGRPAPTPCASARWIALGRIAREPGRIARGRRHRRRRSTVRGGHTIIFPRPILDYMEIPYRHRK
jgi:hypothetical protein